MFLGQPQKEHLYDSKYPEVEKLRLGKAESLAWFQELS